MKYVSENSPYYELGNEVEWNRLTSPIFSLDTTKDQGTKTERGEKGIADPQVKQAINRKEEKRLPRKFLRVGKNEEK